MGVVVSSTWVLLQQEMISGPQYRKLMLEYNKTGNITASASKSGMDRGTAAKYIHSGEGPGERERTRHWRTREDPFCEVWPEVEGWLHGNPRLEATTAFEDLDRRYPGKFEEGQLRSLQRRFRQWKLEHGHNRKPVYFEQEHDPGRLLELDWFRPRDFEVTEVYRFLWRLDSLIFIFLSLVVLNASRQRGLCCEWVTYFFKLDRVLVSQR